VANAGKPQGVGYLDSQGRCTRDVTQAQRFATEDDAWTFAANSGEQVPEDAWAEATCPSCLGTCLTHAGQHGRSTALCAACRGTGKAPE